MSKEQRLYFFKKHIVESFIVCTILLIYVFGRFVIFSDKLSHGLTIAIQAILIPLFYIGMFVIMIIKRTYKSDSFSKLFYQSYLIYAIPLHVMVYYMVFADFNPIILFFIGAYLLFSFSYFFFVRIKGGKLIKTLFWGIDILLQLSFIYIWILVIGFQNITI